MFIQGDLQAVFDALYSIGAIDPILNKDWTQINEEMQKKPQVIKNLCEKINSCSGNKKELVKTLLHLDSQSLEFITVEVAREFSDFQERTDLH